MGNVGKAVPNYIFVSRKFDLEKPTRQPGEKKTGPWKKNKLQKSPGKVKKSTFCLFFLIKYGPKPSRIFMRKKDITWDGLMVTVNIK